VNIARSLVAQLAALTQALDDDVDLEAQLRVLIADIEAAVASYAGLTMTVVAGGQEISFTVRTNMGTSGEITASLRIPLDGEPSSLTGSRLVLYATTPGSFVDLAADLSYTLALEPRMLALDADLVAPPPGPAATGLADHSMINQALGILIDQGHTLESAHSALSRLAEIGSLDLAAAAERLLHAASGPDQSGRPAAGDMNEAE
jgi:hypothetical protein